MLFIAFHSQTNSRTKKQNNIMKAYLMIFVYYRYNNWARLLLIVKFVYNNTKNTSIDYTLFELNYGYNSNISYKKDNNLCLKLKSANKLLIELWKLITIYK